MPDTTNQHENQLSDEELVAKALEDHLYFGHLVRRYESKLLRYICRLISQHSDEAEDVLQEVFIKAYRNLNDFNPSLKFSSWIYRIAHNEAISLYRKRKSRVQEVSIDEVAELDLGYEVNSVIEELGVEHDAHMIRSIFSQMDPKYKEVLELRFFDGMDYAEISDIIRRPIGTVSAMINRAKKQFKQISQKNSIQFDSI
ncbi:MAG: sigma-70 family RNA polymerase sigma factor [Patescibacteria group bacterium]